MKTLVLTIVAAAFITVAGALWIHNDSSLDAAPDVQGNVDCDLDVDAVDALHVLRSTVGLPTTAECLAVGDVDCDSDVDAVDALHILRYTVRLLDVTPSDCPPIGLPIDTTDLAVDGVVTSFLAADGITPISEIPVDTEFKVQVLTTVTNKGPATVDISMQSGLATPADCSPIPADVSVGLSSVGLGESRTSDVEFTVSCSSPSAHQFTGSGSVSITSGQTDTNPANDGPVTDDASIPVIADVDLAVSGVTVDAPATATQNVAFDVTVSGSVDNPAGFGAVTADVTFSLSALPADCTGTTSVTDQDQPLATGANPVQHVFSVTCTTTGPFDLTGDVSVVVDQLHVTDSSTGNNTGTDTGSTEVKSVPVAVNDAATVAEESAATTIAVLANDTDVDGDTLSVSSVTDPADGAAVISGGGTTVDYTPDADFCGTDSFDYVVTDGLLNDTGAVTVTVTCVNDAPVAVDDAATVAEDLAATTIAVLANDTDVDGPALSVSSVTDPADGAAVISGGGTTVDYTPDANFCGSADIFTYTAADGNGGTDTATVTVTVTCVNDLPTCAGASVTTDEDTTSSPFSLNCSDADDDPITCSIVTPSTLGTLNITDCGSATFTPDANECGSGSATYKANDGTADSADATVTVTVTCVNDAPPQATVTVNKVYSPSGPEAAVPVTLTCDSGTVTPGTGSVGSGLSSPGSPPVFTVTGFDVGTTCTATEQVPEGYEASYDNCAGIVIADGSASECTITNTLVTLTLSSWQE